MKNKPLFFILLILFFLKQEKGFSHTNHITSIELSLLVQDNDSIEVEVLKKLFYSSLNKGEDSALIYNNRIFEISKKDNDDYAFYVAYFNKATYFSKYSIRDSAIIYYEQALSHAYGLNNENLQAATHYQLGLAYSNVNQLNNSISHIKKAITLNHISKNIVGEANAYNVLGGIYYKKGELNSAIHYCIKADSILSKAEESPAVAAILYNIGGVFLGINDFERAESYFSRSLEQSIKTSHENNQMIALLGLGEALLFQEKYSEAEEKLKTAKPYFEKSKDMLREAEASYLLGQVYSESNNLDKALRLYLKALEINKEIKDSSGIVKTNYLIGELYLKEKNFSKSHPYFLEAEQLSRKLNNIQTRSNATLKLAEVSTLLNNFEDASYYYQQYIPLKDKVLEIQNRKQINELEQKYQSKKKEQEIEMLSINNSLLEEKKRNQRNLFIGTFIVLLLVGVFLYYGYQNKIKTAQKLKEIDELKSRFFANISHEFRSPLTLIKSPLQILNSKHLSNEDQKHLKLIDQNTNRLLDLVNQLLELSKLESNKIKLLLKKENIQEFLQTILEPYTYQAEKSKIVFKKRIDIQIAQNWFDKDVIEKIISNLLSNALKYTPKNHTINFEAIVENKTLILNISNSGVKLNPNELEKIFERYYQKNESFDGVGIGLALVKELVSLYKGTISITNEEETLSFLVRLPLDKEKLKDVSVFLDDEVEENKNSLISSNENKQNVPVILVADDNKDIRAVLKSIFLESYEVIEAKNGKEALKMAQKKVPDIIISDVMMPKMDGFKFTKKIKENEITSFIPVVLLTAKVGDKAYLEAINNQADAYLTKPFNHEILKRKVSNLLKEREKLRNHYRKELVLKPKGIIINSTEEKFIVHLQKVLDKQLYNPGFSTEDFAKEMGMSRMQLHRKLKALTGFSTIEFIKKERLKKAKEILKIEKNIAEVAYILGFNTPDYFSKLFKEEFGLTPTDFLKT